MKLVIKILQEVLMKKKSKTKRTKRNCELKEKIKMMKSQRSDTEKIIWLKKVKKKGIDEILRQNV